MNRQKVIPRERLPARLPITSTVVWWLLLDRFDAPVWVWASAAPVFVTLWAVAALAAWGQVPTDLQELKDP